MSNKQNSRIQKKELKKQKRKEKKVLKKALKEEKKKTKPKWRYRHPYLIGGLKLLIISGIIIGAVIFKYINDVIKDVPNVSKESLESYVSSDMYASDGTLIWSSSLNKRDYITFEELPQSYIDLLLSTEDATYYKDPGFSPKGVVNAFYTTALEKLGKGQSRGGSSIEQQLIKLSVFSTDEKDRTVERKIKEFFLANQLYENYGKDQILEFYVNKLYLGEGSYGVRTISQTYFGKDLNELTLSQQAIIAGLGQAPSAYNLYDNTELVEKRRNQVLLAALTNEKITQKEYNEAIKTDVTEGLQERFWQESKTQQITKEHDAFVQSALKQVADLGYNLEQTPLQIYTTLRIDQENAVKNIIKTRPDLFQSDTQQVAIAITDPKTGSVTTQIGNRFEVDTIDSFDRASASNRSTGSSIKPLIAYAPGIEYNNWTPNTTFSGAPYHYAGTNIYATNYGGASYGQVTMAESLAKSHNTPALRAMETNGMEQTNYFLNEVGITPQNDLLISNALGLEVSAVDMAVAYGVFANNGEFHSKNYLTKLIFPDNSEKEIKSKSKPVMRASSAYIMNTMLQQVPSKNGTMPEAEIPYFPYAAKTGTVAYPPEANVPFNTAMDMWVVGYTTDIVIALWEGYDEPMAPNGWMYEGDRSPTKHYLFKTLMEQIGKPDSPNFKGFEKPDMVIHQGNKWERLDNNDRFNIINPTQNIYLDPFYIPLTQDFEKLDIIVPENTMLNYPKDYNEGSWEEEFENYKVQNPIPKTEEDLKNINQ